ncbi:hypothetical protein Tco_0270147 [Tanacetum coccineum]
MKVVILFYNGLEVPTRQILDYKGAIPTKTTADAKIGIQEMAEYSQKWYNRTSKIRSTETFDGLAAIQAQLNNLGREIKKVNEKVYAAQVGCELCKGPHYTKDCLLKEEGKTLEKAYYTQFGVPFQQGGQYRAAASCKSFSISTAVETDTTPIRCIGSTQYVVLAQQNNAYGATRLDDSLPRKEKDPRSFTLPCLGEIAHTKLTVELADRTVKHPTGIAENILVGIGKFVFLVDIIILDMPEDVKVPLILERPFLSIAHAKIDVLSERMELDLKARLIGETLILNRSLDPLYGDYIELNDLNEPLDLRRNQVDNLKPTIEEGEVVDKPIFEEVKTMNDDKMFYNSIMKDKIEFNELNKLGNFVNAPVFIGNFYVITNFTVVEDMDPYLDEGIGDVIVGEPFCKASCVEVRRFDGIITIRDRDESVTYQMVQSHLRFKHLTDIQCNKILPLLKVSEQDKMNGISHSYQKLKGFYKGVLNLGTEFIRDAKVKERLTCGHISVHEME